MYLIILKGAAFQDSAFVFSAYIPAIKLANATIRGRVTTHKRLVTPTSREAKPGMMSYISPNMVITDADGIAAITVPNTMRNSLRPISFSTTHTTAGRTRRRSKHTA